MKLVLLGPQGSGKGTQGKLLSAKLSIPHISTGAMFRRLAKQQSPVGLKIKECIDKGQLVPDDITNEAVAETLTQLSSFILDGYPRDRDQAKYLDSHTIIDKVIVINIYDDEAIKRIMGRLTCMSCGTTYNTQTNPPKIPDTCSCKGPLKRREDDNKKAIQDRLKVYHEVTQPLIRHYRAQGKILDINGEQSIQDVFEEISHQL